LKNIKENFGSSIKNLNGKKADRYAPLDKVEGLHSEIAEEDLNKYINNSPLYNENVKVVEEDSMNDGNKLA
jgi:hypothetical protein